ncbi:MAG: hypothetical protein DMF38_07255 [Verrucomicrobia bacterium]|nr:MAG: hypothetical protein DMF38_07255 [Verrucomicrobiota bacterium]
MLEPGSVPLPVVTARIDPFIAEGGKGPYPDMEVSRSRLADCRSWRRAKSLALFYTMDIHYISIVKWQA